MKQDSALRIFISIVFGILFIAAGLTGHPGSIIGSLVDAGDMVEGSAS